ncbi:MAG TPA: hypothetical protein VEA60_05585, partial [Allosphingosinicella sp.]|nr:hypothetical protein [Allosphingosinicella sp.]
AVYAAAAAFLAWAAWGWWHDRRLPERFGKVALGMDRAAVEALLGRPDREAACERDRLILPREGCHLVLVYASAFAPVVPTSYRVQLDAGGRVIEADDVPSP